MQRGTVHALIGPNGSGKSTFVNVVSGLYKPSAGRIDVNGDEHERAHAVPAQPRAGVARTFQNLQVWRRMTVLENVLVGAHSPQHGRAHPLAARHAGQPAGRGRHGTSGRGACCTSWDWPTGAGTSRAALAFADQRRLEIARALVNDPDLLLLDEPAAGMHPSEIRDLIDLIGQVRAAGITVLLIEHHVELVMGLSDRVSVLDYGIKIAEGTPAEVRGQPRCRSRAYLGDEEMAS